MRRCPKSQWILETVQAGLLEQFLSKVLREASGREVPVEMARRSCGLEFLNDYPAWRCVHFP